MKELSALFVAISAILTSHWWLVPLFVLGLLWILCRFKPEFWLAPFNYREIYEDLISGTGPRLTSLRKEELERLPDKQRLALHFKNKSKIMIQRIYDQNSLSTSGLKRALCIAFFYPFLLLIGTWIFSDKGVEIGLLTMSSSAPLFVKLTFLLLPIWVFFFKKNIVYLLFKKLELSSGIAESIYNTLVFVAAVAFAVAGAVAGAVAVADVVADVIAGAGDLAALWGVMMVCGALFYFDSSIIARTGGVGVLGVTMAGAGAVIGTVAGAGAGAGSVAFGVNIVMMLAALFVIFGALVIALVITNCFEYLVKGNTAILRLLSPVLLIVVVLFFSLAPWFLLKVSSINVEVRKFDRNMFTVIFFFCSLPVLNAISDWFSVSFTQFCLRHYESKLKQWWVWIIADLLVALVLIVSLFFCIFALLEYMEFWGWPVNPRQMLITFIENPFAQQNIWLILLVLTNLVPTILHLVLIATAFLNGWFNPISNKVKELLSIIELVEGKDIEELEKIPVNERVWCKEDAKAVAFYLVGIPKLNSLLVLSLACPFFYGAYVGVTEILVYTVDSFLS